MFKLKKFWVSPEYESQLRAAGILDIESVSERDFDWFETPNRRRGGWSGVARIVLNPEAPAAEEKAVFLKIQQNHFYIAPNTLFRKRLTFEREFAAMQALQPHCSGIPKVVLFARWSRGRDQGCLLITEALDNWIPLRPWLEGKHSAPAPDQQTLHRGLRAIADTAREIHQAGWVHMCFSGKHLFLKEQDDGSFAARVVDLEKTRRRFGSGRRTCKDCSHFMRHTPGLTDADKICFLKAYFQTEQFTPTQKALIRRMRGAPKL